MNCPICTYDIKSGELQGKDTCPECNSTLSPDFIQSLEGIMASTNEKDTMIELDEAITESKAPDKSKSNLVSIIIIIILLLLIIASALYYFLVITKKSSSLPAGTDSTIVDLSDSLTVFDTNSYTDSIPPDSLSGNRMNPDSILGDTVPVPTDSTLADTAITSGETVVDTSLTQQILNQVLPEPAPKKAVLAVKKKSKSRRHPTVKKSVMTAPVTLTVAPPEIVKVEPASPMIVETTAIAQPPSLIYPVMIQTSHGITISDNVVFDRDRVRFMVFSARGMKSLPLDRILRIEFMYDGPINFSDQSDLYLLRANITTRNGDFYKNIVIPELAFHTSQGQKYLVKDKFFRTRSINSVTVITFN